MSHEDNTDIPAFREWQREVCLFNFAWWRERLCLTTGLKAFLYTLVIWRHRVATLRGRKWGSTYHEPSVEYFNNWQNLLDKWHGLERPWNGYMAWRQMKWRQTTQRWAEIIRTITIVKYRQKTRLSFQCAKRLDLKFRQSPVGYEKF